MKSNRFLSPEDRARLDEVLAEIEAHSKTLIGYPCNQDFDYSELNPFLQYPVNNLGDPFSSSNYRLHSHALEREVLDFFAELTGTNMEEAWGYVTNGGTEGNMYGLFLARELNPEGIVYYSEDTHYSVAKVLRVLRMRSIMIKSQENGELDYEDLHETLRLHRDTPAVVFANIGTTMTGAIDGIARIHAIFDDLAIHNHYIHCDAALSGMILPFVDDPPPFRFTDGIDSISISGHKMIGAPTPCGIALVKKSHTERIARSIEYVGVLDTTLSGSRNGITPVYLWYAIKQYGYEGFQATVSACLDNAEYAVERFREAGIDAWRNPHSVTVVFPRPGAAVLERWQIAVYGKIAHIITMPHIDKDLIDQLAEELRVNAAASADVTKGA